MEKMDTKNNQLEHEWKWCNHYLSSYGVKLVQMKFDRMTFDLQIYRGHPIANVIFSISKY